MSLALPGGMVEAGLGLNVGVGGGTGKKIEGSKYVSVGVSVTVLH